MRRPQNNDKSDVGKESPPRLLHRLNFRFRLGLALAGGGFVCFAWLATSVQKGDAQDFDEGVRRLVHEVASPTLTALMRTVTLLGEAPALWVLGAGVVLGFLLVGWRRGTVLFLLTMAGAALLDMMLKRSFQRTRPTPFFNTPLPSSFSFPSGHALLSFCFYGTLAALLTPRLSSRCARFGLWVATTLLVALIGVSRIYLGVHYPSDVLAGYAGAAVWVMAVGFVDRLWPPSRRQDPIKAENSKREVIR